MPPVWMCSSPELGVGLAAGGDGDCSLHWASFDDVENLLARPARLDGRSRLVWSHPQTRRSYAEHALVFCLWAAVVGCNRIEAPVATSGGCHGMLAVKWRSSPCHCMHLRQHGITVGPFGGKRRAPGRGSPGLPRMHSAFCGRAASPRVGCQCRGPSPEVCEVGWTERRSSSTLPPGGLLPSGSTGLCPVSLGRRGLPAGGLWLGAGDLGGCGRRQRHGQAKWHSGRSFIGA